MTATQLILDRPDITAHDWMQATGLKLRSFYQYRRRALGSSSTDDTSLQYTGQDHTRAATRKVRTATPTLAGTGLVQNTAQRTRILYLIFLAPTVASVTNMFFVISQITHDLVSAVTLTTVFALTAIGFTAAGIRSHSTVRLIIALIAFEAFCNCIRIYGGLYDVHTNLPRIDFLAQVQSLLWFLSMKHCATTIGTFTAACIAAVQYSAIWEINKRPQTVATATQQ